MDWSTRSPYKQMREYPSRMVQAVEAALAEQKLEWRINGSSHLEFRTLKDNRRVTLSTTGGTNPRYSAKLRSFLRKI